MQTYTSVQPVGETEVVIFEQLSQQDLLLISKRIPFYIRANSRRFINNNGIWDAESAESIRVNLETCFNNPRFHNCRGYLQEIADLVDLLRQCETKKDPECANEEIEQLYSTGNRILLEYLRTYDNKLKIDYERSLRIWIGSPQFSELGFGNCIMYGLGPLCTAFFIIGLSCLMYGYDENTGFMGPGVDFLQNVVIGTLIKSYIGAVNDGILVKTYIGIVNDAFVRKGIFYTFGYNGNWTQGEYIGGVICYSKEFGYNDNYVRSMHLGDTLELAVSSRNKRECSLKDDFVFVYHRNFITGVFFLSLCPFLILVTFAYMMRLWRGFMPKQPRYLWDMD